MSILTPWNRRRNESSNATNALTAGDWFDQFDQAFTNVFDNGFYVRPRTGYVGPQSYIATDEAEHRISIALPGVPKDAVNVNVASGILTVGYEASGDTYNAAAFSTSFKKTWTLPDDCDVENITAAAEDGVLTITVPRTQAKASTGRSITVQ